MSLLKSLLQQNYANRLVVVDINESEETGLAVIKGKLIEYCLINWDNTLKEWKMSEPIKDASDELKIQFNLPDRNANSEHPLSKKEVIDEASKKLGITISTPYEKILDDYQPILVIKKDGSAVATCIAEILVSALPDDYC